MKEYPSINKIIANENIIAFDKLDGSNIRAEWNRKNGFYKFGTRRRLLDANEPILGKAIELFNNKYADVLDKEFKKAQYNKVTVYFEFFGKNSFAGFHEEDDDFDVVLFDIFVEKKGFIPPNDFIKTYAKYGIPNVLYEGKANNDFVRDVKNGILEDMTFEGVVCKGGVDKHGRVKMFKIKNNEWLSKLKDKFPDEGEFEKYS